MCSCHFCWKLTARLVLLALTLHNIISTQTTIAHTILLNSNIESSVPDNNYHVIILPEAEFL